MILKQMDASVYVWEVHNDWGESKTKSESQVREAQLQMASRKVGTYWKNSGDLGHRNQGRFKDVSDWTQEIRSHQFSLSHPHSFLSLFFVLAWQLSSLKLLHLVRDSKATHPRVLYPEVI